MDIPSSQNQFSAPNFVANITFFHPGYQVHFINYEYWTGSLVKVLIFLPANEELSCLAYRNQTYLD